MRGVYERDKGSGVWWICWHDAEGRRHREKIGPKPLAVAAYQKRKTEVREGRIFPASMRKGPGVLYDRVCDEFKAARPKHWAVRCGYFARVRKWFAGRPASAVTPAHIEERLAGLVESGLTAATANRYRELLSAMYSLAVRGKLVAENPVRAVPMRRENNTRTRYLTAAEEAKLRTVVREVFPGREAEMDLALHTGIRQGEQRSLRWEDVDLEGRLLAIRKSKSGRPRTIPLNVAAIAALVSLRGCGGQRVSPANPRRWFPQAVRAAEVADFRWHDLRHTFASRLVSSGASLRLVQELLGHRSITTTERYAHLSPGYAREAVERLATTTTPAATAAPGPQPVASRKARRTLSGNAMRASGL